jgi:hypothetical protein
MDHRCRTYVFGYVHAVKLIRLGQIVMWPHRAFLCPSKGNRTQSKRFWDLFHALTDAPHRDVVWLSDLPRLFSTATATAGGSASTRDGEAARPVCLREAMVGLLLDERVGYSIGRPSRTTPFLEDMPTMVTALLASIRRNTGGKAVMAASYLAPAGWWVDTTGGDRHGGGKWAKGARGIRSVVVKREVRRILNQVVVCCACMLVCECNCVEYDCWCGQVRDIGE